jgi:glycosyltransferase involved in cell wall biosynthesis
LWLETARRIVDQHRRTPFDLLHAFWADEAGLAAVVAGRVLNRPVVVSIGGWEFTNLPDIRYGAQRFLLKRLALRLTLRRAAFVTVGSEYEADLARDHQIPDVKLRLIPLGVDTERFRPGQFADFGSEPPTLIQAASLIPVKNQRLLLAVLHQAAAELPNLKLKLIGSGPLEADLRDQAQRLGVTDRISWLGQVAYPDMPAAYQAAHLYLQTSLHESQGLSVLEAMACGLPAIGTPVGVVKTVASRPASDSAADLAVQVVEIFRDETCYRQLRAQAQAQVNRNFSLSISIDRFKRLYQQAQ